MRISLNTGGDSKVMIKLTRLDGAAFVLNAELIRYVEERGDTFVTLVSGERLVVSQTMDEVVELSLAYQQRKHFLPPVPVSVQVPAYVDTH